MRPRPTLSPPLGVPYEDTDTVLVDVDTLARALAEDAVEARDLGGPLASPTYMERVVLAATLERRARLGRQAP